MSATVIVLVIRTLRPFYASRPGKALAISTVLVVAATLGIPCSPLAGPLGFASLPLVFIPGLGGIVALYVLVAEAARRWYFRWRSHDQTITRAGTISPRNQLDRGQSAR